MGSLNLSISLFLYAITSVYSLEPLNEGKNDRSLPTNLTMYSKPKVRLSIFFWKKKTEKPLTDIQSNGTKEEQSVGMILITSVIYQPRNLYGALASCECWLWILKNIHRIDNATSNASNIMLINERIFDYRIYNWPFTIINLSKLGWNLFSAFRLQALEY